jgi:glycosyltransferase involved in cell wall biosynthesis
MRILLLTQVYWPEERSAPKNLAALAELLHAHNHEVTVITGFPNHPFGRVYPGYRMRWRQWQQIRGVRVLRLPLYPDHSPSVLRRAWNYTSFALSAATLGAWLTRRYKPEVLFVYLPPLTNWLPIRALELLHGMPVVYWETDLWPDAIGATGRRLRPWLERAIQALDQAVHRRAETTCLNSPGLARRLEEKGIDPARLEVITDWADESLFHPVAPDAELAARYGLTGKFNVVYGGSFGPAQDLATILEAASDLTDLEDLQIVLIGSGEEEAALRSLVAERKLPNVRFVDRQPMTEIHRFYALADVLVAHLRPEPLFALQIPSKIMAYLACGRPILCAIEGSAADVVQDAGAGVVSPPGNPSAMTEAVRRLYEMPPVQLRELGANARRAYLAKYTLEVQAKRFEDVLTRAAAKGKAV